jgi:hypothetical protein
MKVHECLGLSFAHHMAANIVRFLKGKEKG